MYIHYSTMKAGGVPTVYSLITPSPPTQPPEPSNRPAGYNKSRLT